MKRLKDLLKNHEEWLKEQFLEYTSSQSEAGALEDGWTDFFAGLVETAPEVDTEVGVKGDGRGRFLALFESLETPVFILDRELNLESMNQAAAKFLGGEIGSGELAYARECFLDSQAAETCDPVPLSTYLPWLAEALSEGRSLEKGGMGSRFDIAVPMEHGERHFNVSVPQMPGFDDRFSGHAVVLDDITFRVETARQLGRERNRAAHYLDVVGSMVLALDASGMVTMVNRTGCEILGYQVHELLGQDWIELIVPEEQRGDIKEYLYRIFSGEVEIDEEFTNFVITRSGESRLIQWKNRLLTNDSGAPIGVLSSGIDVTEQRAMEDALSEKELWLRNTFVALGEAVLILTPDRNILDANPAAESMFLMSNTQLEDLPVHNLHVDQQYYEEFVFRTQKAFDKGETAKFEFSMRRSNGEIFPTDHSISLILGDDGSPLGIVSVVKDISARKRAEQGLIESEEKFRRIFETIEEGYMVTDLDGNINMVNPATWQLLRCKESDLIGVNIEDLYSNNQERMRFRQVVMDKGAVRGYQMTANRFDGTTLVVEANAHLVKDVLGQPLALEGTFRDITSRIEAERVLRESEKQYRAFFENNHAVMLLVDPASDRIVDANPAASKFYGYEMDVMRAMELNEIEAQSPEEMYAEMEMAKEEGRSYVILKHRLASGAIRDVEVYSGPIQVHGRKMLYSVIHDVTRRIRLEREMTKLATTDGLTGVNNRHQFFSLGAKELQRAKRYNSPLSVLMLDIDFFKTVNDTYGHQAGDLVLKMLAATAISTLRESDVFGRLGGEEFAVILPETGLREAADAAERLREAFAKLVARVGDAEITFTVSIGVTLVRAQDTSIEEVVNRADEALYKAKNNGRNRVERG